TTIRLLLILPFALLMAHGEPHAATLAAGVLVVAIASDVLDGIIARRRGTASAAGGAFDQPPDCLFVTAGLAAMAGRGAAPWILPVLVVVAFAQYVADSYWLHRARPLRTSRPARCDGALSS